MKGGHLVLMEFKGKKENQEFQGYQDLQVRDVSLKSFACQRRIIIINPSG